MAIRGVNTGGSMAKGLRVVEQPNSFKPGEFVKSLRRTFADMSELKVVVLDNYSIHRSKVVKEA